MILALDLLLRLPPYFTVIITNLFYPMRNSLLILIKSSSDYCFCFDNIEELNIKP
jgi:hypothetical protein